MPRSSADALFGFTATTAAVAFIFAASPAARAAGDPFYSPVAESASLPADGLYPRGRKLPFMGYSGDPERDLAEGFTAAGPVYTGEPAYLERAFERGWPVVAHVGRGHSFKDGSPRRYTVDEPTLAEEIGAQVRALAGHKEIVWWAVLPEELRPWRKDEMRYLATVSSAVRANDPLGRPLYHYNPNDRDARWLVPVARQVDILAKGAYVNSTGRKRDRAWVGRGLREMTEAIRAAGRLEVVPIVMPELCEDPDPSEDGEIRAWARHDVYLGLVSGAKGVLIWSLFKRPAVARTWRIWYDAYAGCARELNGELGLGQVFLFGEPRRDLTVRLREGAAREEFSSAEYAYGAERWLFVVNSGNFPAAFDVSGFPSRSRIRDGFGGPPPGFKPGEPLRLELPAYGVAALRFSTE